MSGFAQFGLPLDQAPALTASDFLVAPGNAEAMEWVRRWPVWPSFAIAFWGPAECGKTHLAHILAARAGGVVESASRLGGGDVPRLAALPLVALEDSESGVNEAALFHLVNMLRENGKSLLLTGRAPPARWPLGLPDLRSRLVALPAVAIGAPDEPLLAAMMLKLFADRQLRVGPEIPAYVLPRIERSFAAVRAIVAALDAAALAEQRPVTVPLARAVLGLSGPPDRPDG